MRIKLEGKALRFNANVGVDDEINGANASVRFRIQGDKKTLWDSGIMKAGMAAKPVDLDLKGISMLVLLVDDAGDGCWLRSRRLGQCEVCHAGRISSGTRIASRRETLHPDTEIVAETPD